MIDIFIAVFGLGLIASGIRAIRKRKVRYDYGEAEGQKAVSIGYLWIVLGVLALLGVVFDVGFFREIIKAILSSGG